MAVIGGMAVLNGLLFVLIFPTVLLIGVLVSIFRGPTTVMDAAYKQELETQLLLAWIDTGRPGRMPKHWKPQNYEALKRIAKERSDLLYHC